MDKKFTLGRIPYLVCCPFFHLELDQTHFDYRPGTPAECNSFLSQNLIHAAPSSSIEYATHPDLYVLSPDFCTASLEEVGSVLLFSQLPWQDIQTTLITTHSETSVCLLDILFRQYRGRASQFTIEDSSLHREPQIHQQFDSHLLIGDSALAMKQQFDQSQWSYCYDLGELWHQWQGLPFVFGLWIFRKDALTEGLRWHQRLTENLKSFEDHPTQAIIRWSEQYPHKVPQDLWNDYFGKIHYSLDDAAREGLQRFYELAYEIGRIPQVPTLEFLQTH